MVGVPCSEREHTVPLPCTKQHHSPVYAELRCCVINTFFNNVCPPYKAWERRGGVTPSPPPKPPRQRRRTAQTGARRKGNGLSLLPLLKSKGAWATPASPFSATSK